MKRIAIFLTIILSATGCGPRDNDAITTEPTSPADSTVEDDIEPDAPDDTRPPPSTTTTPLEPSTSTDSSTTSAAPSEIAGTEPATSADDTQDALAEANAALALLDELLAAMNAEIDSLGSDLAADANATASAGDT